MSVFLRGAAGAAVVNDLRPRQRNVTPCRDYPGDRHGDLLADPHSPWQRGSNENASRLLRQYFPKGMDLSVYKREELDAIADSHNTRPRKTLDWRAPLEVYAEVLKTPVSGPATFNSVGLEPETVDIFLAIVKFIVFQQIA